MEMKNYRMLELNCERMVIFEETRTNRSVEENCEVEAFASYVKLAEDSVVYEIFAINEGIAYDYEIICEDAEIGGLVMKALVERKSLSKNEYSNLNTAMKAESVNVEILNGLNKGTRIII